MRSIDHAKNICIELLRTLINPTTKDINHSIDDILKIFPNLSSERATLFNYLSATFSIFSEDYKILDSDEGYDPWLKGKKYSIRWNFWNRYQSSQNGKIAPDTINRLDNLTDDILDRITDPSKPGSWDKRGMVVGQIQSGKTSNYIGLINKAADSGYRLIVVLAGMHDSLRSQTQIRIDEGFLGFNTQRSLHYTHTNKIGVGLFNPTNEITDISFDLPVNSLTSSHLNGDFSRKVAQSAGLHLRSSNPIIAVVKKNGSILKNLISWLAAWGDKQSDGKILIRNIPFLLIDDEADNASINVSKEKVSAINGCIRALLCIFEQSAYIGYTATPFANIFIPIILQDSVKGIDLTINDYEYKIGQDLFPKDFIINIPSPSNYIGPTRLFGMPSFTSSEMSEESLPLVRIVDDTLQFIPNKHKCHDEKPSEVPDSLKYAIKCFILASAARRIRNQIDVHNSMLVHVTRFIKWQDTIAKIIDNELKFYQRQIEMKTGNLLKELKEIWEKEFIPTSYKIIRDSKVYSDPEMIPVEWEMIESEIYPTVSKIEVRAIHGDKNLSGLSYHNISPLNYFFAEQQGEYLSIIAIGGDKLSRGLTLEGLSISYYLRASKMYDTLMQMGRWFGYRPGYLDLCRLFISNELITWYKHITIASEEVRKEFDYMFLLNKTPKDYGLKVRTHPGILKITAANKFRYKKIMSLSYSGTLEQTYQFKIDKKIFENNYKATLDLISTLGCPVQNPINSYNLHQKYVWKGENNFYQIKSFLMKYKAGREVMDTDKIVDYITIQAKNKYLTNWTIALINNSMAKAEDEYFIDAINSRIGLTERTNVSKDLFNYVITKCNITDHKHELIDLSEEELILARKQSDEDNPNNSNTEEHKIPSRKRIKWIRNSKNALLLIYPLKKSINQPNSDNIEDISDFPIIGIALSFPEIENDEKIEYAVNEQFIKEFDYPDELDLNEYDDDSY